MMDSLGVIARAFGTSRRGVAHDKTLGFPGEWRHPWFGHLPTYRGGLSDLDFCKPLR
jgi:hypothetical protein